jgi:hypothetical protein
MKYAAVGECTGGKANKKMHVTLPALASFGMIARHKSLVVSSGLILPFRALAGHVILVR